MNDDVISDAPDGRDEPVDQRVLAELTARLRSVPSHEPAVRSAHLAAALEAFDEQVGSTDRTNVARIAPALAPRDRDRRQRVLQRFAIAAGLLLIAGLGIGVAINAGDSGSNDSSATVAADAAPSTTATASAKSAPAPMAAADAGAAAAPEVQPRSAAPDGDLPDLGAFEDDAALSLVMSRPAPATTTAAPTPIMGAETPSCPTPAGAEPLARAIVAGRPVVVMAASPTPGDAPGAKGLVLVDQLDCSTRPL